jgi:hypothetical protein
MQRPNEKGGVPKEMTIEVKPPSAKFFKLLDEVIDHQVKSREKYDKAIQSARDEGFSDFEIMTFVRDYLKTKIPETTLRRYLEELKPKLEDSSVVIPPVEENDDNNDMEQETEIVVTTDGLQTTDYEEEQDEEPSELDLLKIRNAQLEDALHKTEQFKPATQLQEDPHVKEFGFDFLRKMADGVSSFYYDAYGIDLFKNRELAQLKNSGVKTFKRLYFEV